MGLSRDPKAPTRTRRGLQDVATIINALLARRIIVQMGPGDYTIPGAGPKRARTVVFPAGDGGAEGQIGPPGQDGEAGEDGADGAFGNGMLPLVTGGLPGPDAIADGNGQFIGVPL